MSALVVNAPVGLETGTQHDLADHLRNHDHAHVAAKTFMAAKAKMKIVVPVASGDEVVRIFKGSFVEHR